MIKVFSDNDSVEVADNNARHYDNSAEALVLAADNNVCHRDNTAEA